MIFVVKSNRLSVAFTCSFKVSLSVILIFLELMSSKLINPGQADEDQSNAIKLKKRLEYAISKPKQRVFKDVGTNEGLELLRLADTLLTLVSVVNNETIKLDTITVDTKPTNASVTLEHII